MEQEVIDPPTSPLNNYVCVRCGFSYQKQADYEPYLCYRCIRFIAKRTWQTIHQITPPARTVRGDI